MTQPNQRFGTDVVRAATQHLEIFTDATPGELVVRHSAAEPRKGFFSGYLKIQFWLTLFYGLLRIET